MKRIVADSIQTAFESDPEWMALVIKDKDGETTEVFFKTGQAPALVAGILASSQDAVRKMAPAKIVDTLARHYQDSCRNAPEAVDLALAADGDVLVVNVGSGPLFLKLTSAAKQALQKLQELK